MFWNVGFNKIWASFFGRTLLLSLSFFVLGCSQRYQDTNATIMEAFYGPQDIEISEQQLRETPYASMYVKINDGPRIFMVLAFVERNGRSDAPRLKWVSADRAMLVTENGRIVKTLNLPNANLVDIEFSEDTPFSSSNIMSPTKSDLTLKSQHWQATYDWQPMYQYNHLASVETRYLGKEQFQSLLWNKSTFLFEESIEFSALNQSMTSRYWLDDKGATVKSSQWLIPEQLHIELEILKPYSFK